MFKFFKNYKDERDKLLLENSNLIIELNKYSELDKKLFNILNEKLDLSDIDLTTKGERQKVAAHATSIMNNPIFIKVINSKRHKLIMSAVNDSRDYNELVQKRANLLFIEESLLKEFRKLSSIDQENEKAEYNDFDFNN